MPTLNTYSFMTVNAAIDGPGGNFQLGYGSGNADEGITVEMADDKDTMTAGADGSVMHSLHAASHGTITIRLLKTSPTNQLLQAMYNAQQGNPANWGQNTITVKDAARGDSITASACAFTRQPALTFAKDGGMNEWKFNAGFISQILGSGV